VWSYELWEAAAGGNQRVQETDSIWLGADGRYERFFGYEVQQTGVWRVTEQPALELLPDGAPAETWLNYPVSKATSSAITLTLPTGAGGDTDAVRERVYEASERCPAYLSRTGGRYALHFVDILTPETQFAGALAVDFDSQGDLHAVVSRAAPTVESFYATTVGARCGFRLYAFAPHSGARMEIDKNDTIHLAYADGTSVKYASRPARGGAEAPWQVTTVGGNTLTTPTLSLALAPDGAVAITANRDDGSYIAFQSRAPLSAEPAWLSAPLPVTKQPGADWLYGVSAAFDPASVLHVAGTAEGTAITVYRDAGESWESFALPEVPVKGSFFDGPQSFAIAADGTWHIAVGSVGQVNTRFGPGRPGALLHGHGSADAFVWDTVGAGGIASIAVDAAGQVHLHSFDRNFGGLHTVLKNGGAVPVDAGFAGDHRAMFAALARESTLDRPALAIGPNGEVGIGVGDAIQVLPAEGALSELKIAMGLAHSGAEGAMLTLPDLGESCGGACSAEVTEGQWVRWSYDAPSGYAPSMAQSTPCLGKELTGSCWVLATQQACSLGQCPPHVSVTFVQSDVVEFFNTVALEDTPSAWAVKGAGGSEDGVDLLLSRTDGQAALRIARWSADMAPLPSIDLAGWAGARSFARLGPDEYAVMGAAQPGTSLGGENDFGGEQVLVGITGAGDVVYVHRAAGEPAHWAAPVGTEGGGVALLTAGGLARLSAAGAEEGTTPLDGIGELEELTLLRTDGVTHVVGPVRADVLQSAVGRSRWLRIPDSGVPPSAVELAGRVLAAAVGKSNELHFALLLSAGVQWEGSVVGADALALEVVSSAGEVLSRGPADTSLFNGMASTSGWVSALGLSAGARANGALRFAVETSPGQTLGLELGASGAEWLVQLGGQGVFGSNPRKFHCAGLVVAGTRTFVAGIAQGPFDFGAIQATYDAPAPVLVELP
jgi:hypothetical protein